MTKKKEISEKTLELNVCAEMLRCLRARPDCRRALWVGLTQKQEREEGLDERLRGAPGVALMLQFKAPRATSRSENVYTFSINRKQHRAIESLGQSRAAHYVFPLYRKWCKADKHAPNLLQDTWLIPASCIPSSQLVRDSTPVTVTKHDESRVTVKGYPNWEITCDAINAEEYFDPRPSRQTDFSAVGLPVSFIREWVDFLDLTRLRFRNLAIIYIPV